MPQHPRYAIYFVPSADSALYRFGAGLLGYDAFTGKARCRLLTASKRRLTTGSN